MSSSAQIRASRKYNEKNLIRYSLSLNTANPDDVELIDFITTIKSNRSFNGFIKELLHDYIDKEL